MHKIVNGQKVDLSHHEEAALLIERALNDKENSKKRIKKQIIELEATQTPRRVREALINGEIGFFEEIEVQIVELRKQLNGE